MASTVVFADVSHEEETKMGGLAGIASFGRAMKTKTEVSGDFMRTETGSDVTLVDLSQEKIFTLDPKKKTYTVTTFAEMRERLESAMQTGQSQMKQGQSEGQATSSDVSATTDVRVTETGRTETIDGHDCRQFLLELDVTLESEQQQQAGTMTMLTELWVAKDVPGMDEVQDFQRRMAEKLGTAAIAKQMFGGGRSGGQQNPFGGEMDMERMAAEMQKIDGFPLRTVVYFGSGEAAKKEAMGEKPSGGGGFGNLMKKMTIPGGGGGGDEQGGEGAVMMRVTTETKKIETKSIDKSHFVVPSDYRQVEGR